MPAPSGVKVEIEFTAGVWTDVTADVDYNGGWTVHIGRAAPSGSIQPGSATVVLKNPTGKYTPGVQVLSDGTASTTYPNITPRKRLRLSNSSGVRFIGYIKSWTPGTNGYTGASFCTVTALDRLDPLSRVVMRTPLVTEVVADTPLFYWPLTDSTSATYASEASGGSSLITAGTGPAITFGNDGPGTGEGTGFTFAPAAVASGQYLLNATTLPASTIAPYTFTVECWINPGLTAPAWSTVAVWGLRNGQNLNCAMTLVGTTGVTLNLGGGSTIVAAGTAVYDGNWHHIVAAFDTANIYLYIDGALAVSGAFGFLFGDAQLQVGSSWLTPSRYQGGLGQFVISPLALTAARVTAHYNAGLGWNGEKVDARVKRFLSYSGLTAPDYNLDPSTVICGSYTQDGKDITSACQDMAVTEGVGSAVYVLAGVVQFKNRAARNPATATLTITAGADDDRGGYTPTLDDANLVNQVTANRATASGTQSSQTFADAASIAAYGLTAMDVTTYTNSDPDALALAQSIVASGRTPAWRLPQVTVDLLTSPNNLYAAVQSTVIGSKITVQTLPAGQAPATTVTLRVEGWTERVAFNQYLITFDTTADDNPARGIVSDATYGSAQCDGQTLNASLTNSATTVVIATSGGKPTFTTAAGMYPLKITVGAERLTLNTAPGGAATPQTFTGITRGVDGTTASAQASAAPVTVWPRITATL